MRTLAVVAGAPGVGRSGALGPTPGRVSGFVARLAALGPVDLVVFHDELATADTRRTVSDALVPVGGVARRLEVATVALRRSGFIREVHLHRADADEVSARARPEMRLADSFIASSPSPHDLVWCSDLASLTRAGWLRRHLAAVVDVDRDEDLSSTRLTRAARRAAVTAHLVTVADDDRRDELAVPGSIVVDPTDDHAVRAAFRSVAAGAAAYRPVRSEVSAGTLT